MPVDESYVQVALDGAGKKIRQLKVERTLSDGTVVIEYMQLVALLDSNGEPLDLDEEREYRLAVLTQLRLINKILMTMLADDTHDVDGKIEADLVDMNDTDT